MTKTLSDISRSMKDIDLCMLVSRGLDGALDARPMSNNREVDYHGTSWFFTTDDTQLVAEIAKDPAVGVTYGGKAGLWGLIAPRTFIHVDGHARVIRDRLLMARHWRDALGRWFKHGLDTPGLALIEVEAHRIRYWEGNHQGEVALPAIADAA